MIESAASAGDVAARQAVFDYTNSLAATMPASSAAVSDNWKVE